MDAISLRAMQDELSGNEKLAAALARLKKGKGVPVTALFPKLAFTMRDVGVATAGLGAAGGALGAARAHQKGESKAKGALKGALIGGSIPAGVLARMAGNGTRDQRQHRARLAQAGSRGGA